MTSPLEHAKRLHAFADDLINTSLVDAASSAREAASLIERLYSGEGVELETTAKTRTAFRDRCASILKAFGAAETWEAIAVNCIRDIDTLLALLAAERERAGRMEKALRPFARVADLYDDREDDSFQVHRDAHEVKITLGQCRAARAALNGEQTNG